MKGTLVVKAELPGMAKDDVVALVRRLAGTRPPQRGLVTLNGRPLASISRVALSVALVASVVTPERSTRNPAFRSRLGKYEYRTHVEPTGLEILAMRRRNDAPQCLGEIDHGNPGDGEVQPEIGGLGLLNLRHRCLTSGR